MNIRKIYLTFTVICLISILTLCGCENNDDTIPPYIIDTEVRDELTPGYLDPNTANLNHEIPEGYIHEQIFIGEVQAAQYHYGDYILGSSVRKAYGRSVEEIIRETAEEYCKKFNGRIKDINVAGTNGKQIKCSSKDNLEEGTISTYLTVTGFEVKDEIFTLMYMASDKNAYKKNEDEYQHMLDTAIVENVIFNFGFEENRGVWIYTEFDLEGWYSRAFDLDGSKVTYYVENGAITFVRAEQKDGLTDDVIKKSAAEIFGVTEEEAQLFKIVDKENKNTKIGEGTRVTVDIGGAETKIMFVNGPDGDSQFAFFMEMEDDELLDKILGSFVIV